MYTFYKLVVAMLRHLRTETMDLVPSPACGKPWCILASRWHNLCQPLTCYHPIPTSHAEHHSAEHQTH